MFVIRNKTQVQSRSNNQVCVIKNAVGLAVCSVDGITLCVPMMLSPKPRAALRSPGTARGSPPRRCNAATAWCTRDTQPSGNGFQKDWFPTSKGYLQSKDTDARKSVCTCSVFSREKMVRLRMTRSPRRVSGQERHCWKGPGVSCVGIFNAHLSWSENSRSYARGDSSCQGNGSGADSGGI